MGTFFGRSKLPSDDPSVKLTVVAAFEIHSVFHVFLVAISSSQFAHLSAQLDSQLG